MIVPRNIAAFLRILDKGTSRVGQQKILFRKRRRLEDNSEQFSLWRNKFPDLFVPVALRLLCSISSVYK